MSVITELARKQAGISDMSKGYPKNPRQRGAAYWTQYHSAVGVLTDQQASELEKVLKENAKLARRVAELERDTGKKNLSLASERVRNLAHEMDLPEVNRDRLIGVVNNSG